MKAEILTDDTKIRGMAVRDVIERLNFMGGSESKLIFSDRLAARVANDIIRIALNEMPAIDQDSYSGKT